MKKIIIIFALLLMPLTINATSIENQNGIPSMQVPPEQLNMEQSPSIINPQPEPIINPPINNDQPVNQTTQMPTDNQTPSKQIMDMDKQDKQDNNIINDIKSDKYYDKLTPEEKILNNGGFATKSLKESAIKGEQDAFSLAKFSIKITIASVIFSVFGIIIALTNLDSFDFFLPITIIIFAILFAGFSIMSTMDANVAHKEYVEAIKFIESQEYITNNFIEDTKQIILRDIDTTTQENINLWLTNIQYDNISREILSQIIAEKYKLAFINGQMSSMDTFIKKEIDIYNNTIDNLVNNQDK